MSTAPEALTAPPLDSLVGEMIATLALVSNAYLEPREGQPDLDSAALACDIAGIAFERITPRLRSEDRVALGALLTQLRLTIVKKRG
jgi:hypothetical protein